MTYVWREFSKPGMQSGPAERIPSHKEATNEMILTSDQQQQVSARAADTQAWRDEDDLVRRRKISDEVRLTIENSQILQGSNLDHKTFCKLVSLQWQIQNLNPMTMPRLLGTYHYQVHFRGFEGTPDDLLAAIDPDLSEGGMYEGADLSAVTEALRLIFSPSADSQYAGARAMLEVPGAGLALVSGFLHLCHPDRYALINKASIGPFAKDGWLNVVQDQRRQALVAAKQYFAAVANEGDDVLKDVFRYWIFLDEVRQICKFEDFHVVDQFVWALEGIDQQVSKERLQRIVDQLPSEASNVQVRVEAEAKARQLVESNLGHLSTDQFRTLFELINTCVGKKGVAYNRFAPAFVGHNANLLIERAEELNVWIRKLWTASDAELPTLLDQFWEQNFTGGGRSFPTAILYLRDKEKYAVWTLNLELALYAVVTGLPAKIRTGFSYLRYCDRVRHLRKLAGFAPELHDWVLSTVFTAQAPSNAQVGAVGSGSFTGFAIDTFQFMVDLVANNNQTWFAANEHRFRTQVDQPLRALVKDLGNEVITSLDPTLETSPKSNKCISRIRKNTYGNLEADVYQPSFWAAFYRKDRTKQTDCQFYIVIRKDSLSFGVFFGEQAEDVRVRLIQAIDKNPGLAKKVFASIQSAGFLYIPEESETAGEHVSIESYDQFVEFVKTHHFNVCRSLSPAEAQSAGTAIKAQIGQTFRTLYPLFKLAVSDDPENDIPPYLQGFEEEATGNDERITIADVAAATFLEEAFFAKLDLYLQDKQQLVFAGPPGTGKTHVALKYAEYLTQDKGKVRNVQFHPSYSYEDFMEGLRPTTRNGQLVYEVEDGIFKKLCDEARADAKGIYVVLIDEINRGNLARILGELLFLLERRTETIDLPYSKKRFSIPRNVIVLGTMNSSDRSIALMDLALRRRFHFVTMEPRREVLRAWLIKEKKPLWIEDLFRRLNDALHAEKIDDDHLVGHAHFMSNSLSEEFLELIWEGTIQPMLKEYFFTEPERLKKFQLEKFKERALTALEDEIDDPDDDEFESSHQNPSKAV